jgi:hypothetical protein
LRAIPNGVSAEINEADQLLDRHIQPEACEKILPGDAETVSSR